MIMIGNGPIPLAHPGPPGPGASTSGNAVRTVAAGQGAVPEATIPAAQPERSGGSPGASNRQQSYTAAIRPVLGPSRIDATVTDPEDRYRMPDESRRDSTLSAFLNDRDPVPPLRSYANVPTATSIAIEALQAERAERKAETRSAEEESPREADRADAPQDPGNGPGAPSAPDREAVTIPPDGVTAPAEEATISGPAPAPRDAP